MHLSVIELNCYLSIILDIFLQKEYKFCFFVYTKKYRKEENHQTDHRLSLELKSFINNKGISIE